MRLFKKVFRLPIASVILSSVLAGCVSIAPIEPVKNPPLKYRANSVVLVEFVHPMKVGLRCAERGASAHGIPIAMACADRGLMTMPNPCVTITGGSYANIICEQKRRPEDMPNIFSQISLASVDPRLRPRALNAAQLESHKFILEFARPEDMAARCETRGLTLRVNDKGLQSCGNKSLMTIANPCLKMGSGWYARQMCHELGHVNGWSANHRGGSYRSDRALGINSDNIPPANHIVEIMMSDDVPPPASASPTYLAYKAQNQLKVAEKPELDAAPSLLLAAADTSAETIPALESGDALQLDIFGIAPAQNLQFASSETAPSETGADIIVTQWAPDSSLPLQMPPLASPIAMGPVSEAAKSLGQDALNLPAILASENTQSMPQLVCEAGPVNLVRNVLARGLSWREENDPAMLESDDKLTLASHSAAAFQTAVASGPLSSDAGGSLLYRGWFEEVSLEMGDLTDTLASSNAEIAGGPVLF